VSYRGYDGSWSHTERTEATEVQRARSAGLGPTRSAAPERLTDRGRAPRGPASDGGRHARTLRMAPTGSRSSQRGSIPYQRGRELYQRGREVYQSGRELYQRGREVYQSGREVYQPGREVYQPGREVYQPGRESGSRGHW
jgi:hypothetical protein